MIFTPENQGRIQEVLDILPLLTYENYLEAYPEERKCRAFVQFYVGGDVESVTVLRLAEDAENGTTQLEASAILRYQDLTKHIYSTLPLALIYGETEIL